VSREDNDALALSFTMEELEEVIKNTKTATAPGLDGLPVAFFKNFWPLLKDLIFCILNGFALGTLDISRLNFGILSLIPKVLGAESIKQYRPIALINVIFKFVSKAVANRLSPVANKVITPTQTAFIKGGSFWMVPSPYMKLFMTLKSKSLKQSYSKLILRKPMTG
jgi:hypothetical protein